MNLVIRAWLLAVLELGLRYRGAEVHVPQRWRLNLVGQLLLEKPQEHHLRHALSVAANRRVGHRPVHRQAEVAPQVLEDLFVGDGQLRAELDEVRP
jgi:hypothetical protein